MHLVEIRVNYQLDANIVYFSSTSFGLIHPTSGAIEFIISFTNAAYGSSATHHERAHSSRHLAAPRTPYAAFVKEIINSIAPEDGCKSPKLVELK